MAEMTRTVLDASALLALIQGERGSERVLQALEQGDCVISTVNLSEAMTKLILNGMPIEAAEQSVAGIPANPLPCDASVAMAAARLTALGKPLGLSLGDRICLATAQTCGKSTVLTTDRAWQRLALPGILIETIRQPNPAR
jgi:PIN domain nuclease of toxin-antitoxin system